MHCLLKVVTKNGRGALESQWRIYRGISQRSALVGKRVSIRVAGHQEQRRRQRQTHKRTPPKKMFSFMGISPFGDSKLLPERFGAHIN